MGTCHEAQVETYLEVQVGTCRVAPSGTCHEARVGVLRPLLALTGTCPDAWGVTCHGTRVGALRPLLALAGACLEARIGVLRLLALAQ